MVDQSLLHPLLPTTSTTRTSTITITISSSTSAASSTTTTITGDINIVCRILFIILIGILSIWANHEASKGFEITIVNDAKHSSAGKRFNLLYVSNGKAIRILQNTTTFLENILYNSNAKNETNKIINIQQIRHVRLHLSPVTTQTYTVSHETDGDKRVYVIRISSSVMEDVKFDYAFKSVLQRAMERLWLYEHKSTGGPPWLVEDMTEYITTVADFGGGNDEFRRASCLCWDDRDPKLVSLSYCEGHSKGFIQRLNQEMMR